MNKFERYDDNKLAHHREYDEWEEAECDEVVEMCRENRRKVEALSKEERERMLKHALEIIQGQRPGGKP